MYWTELEKAEARQQLGKFINAILSLQLKTICGWISNLFAIMEWLILVG